MDIGCGQLQRLGVDPMPQLKRPASGPSLWINRNVDKRKRPPFGSRFP
ncbi:hypothetical protein GLE_5326 [Lysobacter enzymogenes]|uniref:Uncharacterized protein n=1 Tax=Lysobacter enzymogenes TaxID=69 RepID=A0A0S2DPL2_LYSEN|nr:hypothetical protein GLE_5326 [Lysobacter enzymogenes]